MRRTLTLRLTLLPMLAAAAVANAQAPCEISPAPDGIDEVPDGFDDPDCTVDSSDLAYLIVPRAHTSYGGFGAYVFTTSAS